MPVCATRWRRGMLEHGADVQVIQEILGHAQLTTTQLYTRVSIWLLKAVHTATHPAAKLGRPASSVSLEIEPPPLAASDAAKEDSPSPTSLSRLAPPLPPRAPGRFPSAGPGPRRIIEAMIGTARPASSAPRQGPAAPGSRQTAEGISRYPLKSHVMLIRLTPHASGASRTRRHVEPT